MSQDPNAVPGHSDASDKPTSSDLSVLNANRGRLFLFVLFFFALCGVLLWLCSGWLGGAESGKWPRAFLIGFCLSLVGALMYWGLGKATAGRLLDDFGPFPHRRSYLLSGALFLVIGVAAWAAAPPATLDLTTWKHNLLFIYLAAPVLGVSNMIVGLGRLQVRERGLWVYFQLAPWRRMRDVVWDGNVLRYRQVFQSTVPVPVERLETFRELVEQRMRHAVALPSGDGRSSERGSNDD